MASERSIHLLLGHADDRSPVLGEGLPAEAEEIGIGEGEAEAPLVGADALAESGWGVVAPSGEVGDAMLTAIAPLLAHREAGLGRAVRVVRAPAGLRDDEAAGWRREVYDVEAGAPRFRLILGDLDQVSLAVQEAVTPGGAVGRLACADLVGYERYAAKVVAWERAAPPPGVALALYHTVHDGSAATALGRRTLAQPLVALAREGMRRGRFPGQVIELGDPDEADPEDLLEGAEAYGGVLFSLGLGEGAPRAGWRSPIERRRGQGAIAFGRAGSVRAGDLALRPFVPGGVWWLCASFGAGTPARSRYERWLARVAAAAPTGPLGALLEALPRGDDRPFVAALPKAALANLAGPLAVVAPLDLAWVHGLGANEVGRGERVRRTHAFIRAILRGEPVGAAFRGLGGQGEAGGGRRGEGGRWLLRQEVASLMLLGDPAVRLPRAGGTAGREGAWGVGPAPVDTPVGHMVGEARPTIDAASVEAAIHAILADDDEALHAHLDRLGVDLATVRGWMEVYAAAGREAVARALAKARE